MTGGELSTTGPPEKSQKSLDLKRLRFYKHLYQTPKKNHQNANYTRKGKKLPTFREDSIKPCCPENGYTGGDLEQGRVIEGTSVLNYVTQFVTVDISPDVSQPIIELPPLVSSTKRMMFFQCRQLLFSVCYVLADATKEKVQLLLETGKVVINFKMVQCILAKQNFAWKKNRDTLCTDGVPGCSALHLVFLPGDMLQ